MVPHLGCQKAEAIPLWIDYNMYGHQYVCHLNPHLGKSGKVQLHYNPLDKHSVPVPNAGVVLETADRGQLTQKLQKQNIQFIIEPYIRFKGQPGEQATMFFLDPSGNALGFKSFNNIDESLFKK